MIAEKWVVMGVSGCGKTSLGSALARRWGATFIDADDLHTPENVAKMASGVPLTDEDRGPWLREVARALADTSGPAVLACSALRRVYRDTIRAAASEDVHFLHLHGPQAAIAARQAARQGHFMPASLLPDQSATLEPLEEDEAGATLNVLRPEAEVLDRAAEVLGLVVGAKKG